MKVYLYTVAQKSQIWQDKGSTVHTGVGANLPVLGLWAHRCYKPHSLWSMHGQCDAWLPSFGASPPLLCSTKSCCWVTETGAHEWLAHRLQVMRVSLRDMNWPHWRSRTCGRQGRCQICRPFVFGFENWRAV